MMAHPAGISVAKSETGQGGRLGREQPARPRRLLHLHIPAPDRHDGILLSLRTAPAQPAPTPATQRGPTMTSTLLLVGVAVVTHNR